MSDEGSIENPAQAYQEFLVPTLFLPWAGELIRRVVLVPGEQVLDIACGTGVVAREAAKIVGPGGSVTGVDISPSMLDVARASTPKGGTPVDWKSAHAEALPFEDGSFSATLCQQGLQFVGDRGAALHEMYRVLKPGGRAGVSVWRGLEHQSVKGALFGAMQRQFGEKTNIPFSLGEEGPLRALFDEAGFRDVAVGIVRRQVEVPDIDQFVSLTILGASAAIPALARASDTERTAAVNAIKQEIKADLDAVRVGEGMEFPMESHIVIARK